MRNKSYFGSIMIHKDGRIFVIASIVLALILLFLGTKKLGFVFLCIAGFCGFFFRDPNRVVPKGDNYVISPADGRIVDIAHDVNLPKELDMPVGNMIKISIFLNVFDVHVNRVPVRGVVEKTLYKFGKFFNASLDKASEYNERQSVVIKSVFNGSIICCVQIAGLIARRIVCNLKEKDVVEGGKRYGIIKFGSRVDLYIPAGVGILVAKDQRVIGGETVLADLSTQSSREFTNENNI